LILRHQREEPAHGARSSGDTREVPLFA
jgi:hypothetical protein